MLRWSNPENAGAANLFHLRPSYAGAQRQEIGGAQFSARLGHSLYKELTQLLRPAHNREW